MTRNNDVTKDTEHRVRCSCKHGDPELWRALRVIHDSFFALALEDYCTLSSDRGDHIFKQFQTLNYYIDFAFSRDWFAYGPEELLVGHPCPHELQVRRIHAKLKKVFG